MENNELIVGLDIGTTKICAIVGKKDDDGKLEVLGMGKTVSDGVNIGVVTNIYKTVNSINKVLREAEEQSGTNIHVVSVGIASQHIRSSVEHGTHIIDGEIITTEEVEKFTNDMYNIIIPAGKKILHIMPQNYTIDNESDINDPVGRSGIRLEADFNIITADINAINMINKCIKHAHNGLEIKNLILEPLASSLSVLSEEEKESGVCLVDIGGGTTDVAIFYENIIHHTSVISLGGDSITNDIKEGCNILYHGAEKLKTQFGHALEEKANPNHIVSIPGPRNRRPKEISVKNLSKIIQARMEEIIVRVHEKIIVSGLEQKLYGGIVITGGGSQLRNLKELSEHMTGLDARIGYPNEHLGKNKSDNIKNPMYSTCVGLVLSAFKILENVTFLRDSNNENKKQIKSDNFFIKILQKAKKILIDDIENP